MERDIPTGLTKAEGRKFAFTVGIAFLVFGGIALWRDHELLTRILGGLGGVLIVAGLLVPGHLGPAYRAWMGLAHAISKVTTPIFMFIIYFIVFLPVGLLMRLFGRHPLTRGKQDTFWFDADATSTGGMSRQF